MFTFFDLFGKTHRGKHVPGGRSYHCRCGRPVFFQNSRCLACGTELGYDPHTARVLPIEPIPSRAEWRVAGDFESNLFRRCANFETSAACNWLVSDLDKLGLTQGLCIACRLNRTIPDLSVPENGVLWGSIEAAKRRLVSVLLVLDIPVASKDENPESGLAFDFLQNPENGPRVMTGHANGLITLNIEEARTSTREQVREQMNEPYRTLVGHFRHEVGHYYWDRLIMGTPWIGEFRRLFGDERADYAEAVQRNYKQGPPADWPSRFVSAYASTHPWEDWAETWAHYLHIADTLATAISFGLDPRNLELQIEPFPRDALYQPEAPDAERFLTFLNSWITLGAVMNEMSRGMGVADFYPFALPRAAVAKLQFIYIVIKKEQERLKRSTDGRAQSRGRILTPAQ
jgi:hypothetical protein